MTGIESVRRFLRTHRLEYVYAAVLRRNYAKFRGNGISSIPIERTRIRGSVFSFEKTTARNVTKEEAPRVISRKIRVGMTFSPELARNCANEIAHSLLLDESQRPAQDIVPDKTTGRCLRPLLYLLVYVYPSQPSVNDTFPRRHVIVLTAITASRIREKVLGELIYTIDL